MTNRGPGYRAQGTARTVFRILGIVLMGPALTLMVVAFMDFFAAGNSDDFDAEPTKFWMFFVALPLFAVGGWCLQAGFGGAAAKYAAGELAPTTRDTLDYLGVRPGGEIMCPSCRAANDHDARFCDSCGTAMARSCPSCGTAVDGEARFCSSCGASIALS
jgi:hypothetical protein